MLTRSQCRFGLKIKFYLMNYSEENRKLLRLKDFDYASDGAYFVTICIDDSENYFGEIQNTIDTKSNDSCFLRLTEIGEIAKQCWQEIPAHFSDTELDEFVVMPNHIHGIIWIKNNAKDRNFFVGNENFRSLQKNTQKNNNSGKEWHGAKSRSLSSIVRGFKIGMTKWCRSNNHDYFLWQKSFHDHIIRDDGELNRIREYIRQNPQNWGKDRNNPARID
jgi:putative transposase